MTRSDVKRILRTPYKPLALMALSYVNLTDREQEVIIRRHMRGHTQEETAEDMCCTVNALQKWEYSALDKCGVAWDKVAFIQEILKSAQ